MQFEDAQRLFSRLVKIILYMCSLLMNSILYINIFLLFDSLIRWWGIGIVRDSLHALASLKFDPYLSFFVKVSCRVVSRN